MDISKHISYLLQFHECVIIPEFGGFISNYKSAQIDSATRIFVPPSKEVIFNTKINKNDGLLINHLVDSEKIGYHQAQTVVLNFVDHIYSKLEQGEIIHLPGLGSLKYDRSGILIFTPQKRFDLVDAYGLKPVSIENLQPTQAQPEFTPRPAIRVLNNRKDIVKIAASIALLLSLALFPLKNNSLHFQSSNLNPIQLLMADKPVIQNQVTDQAKTNNNDQQLKLSDSKGDPFILVGGSFQLFDNANQLQRTLTASGHKAEIIEQENGLFRVVIDSFNNREKAMLAMKSYRSNHPGSNVWVSIR